MNKRKTKLAVVLIGVSLCLGACANPMPDLSEEQSSLISEYAAGLLLQYSTNYSGKLVNDEQIRKAIEKETRFAANTAEATAKEKKEKTEGSETAESTKQEVQSEADIASFLGLTPLEVSYDGYEICDSYPNNGENLYFAMDAIEGTKLLVLRFFIRNNTSEAANLDMLSSAVKFKIVVNGEEKSVLTTMLPEDFSGYNGTLQAGESSQTVLITQIPEELSQQIQSLSLTMKKGDERAQTTLN